VSIWRAGDTIEVPFYVQDGTDPIEGLTGSMFDVTLSLAGADAPESVTITESEDGGGVYLATFTQAASFDGDSCIYLIVIRTNNTATSQAADVVEREIQVWAIGASVEPWDGVRLCTVGDVHLAMKLPLSSTGKDQMILLLIEAMSEWIGQYLDYEIADHTVDPTDDVYSGSGAQTLVLRRHPVVAVESVTVCGTEIPEAEEVTDAGWVRDGDTLHLRGFYHFTRGVQNVTVTTRWGFSTIPRMLKAACVKLVRYKLDDLTEHPNETYRMENQSQYRWLPDAMPADVREMLDGARRILAV